MIPQTVHKLLLPLALLATACTGTDTGNPFTQPMVVDAHTSNPGEVSIQVSEGGSVITEAWLSIDAVGISEVCNEAPDLSLDALGVADHAEDEILQADFEAEESSYCELQVPWVLAGDGQVPAQVVGTSIYLAGTRADGVPFQIRSTFAGTIRMIAIEDSFELSPDLGGLFLGFDMATWLVGVDLDGAPVSVDNDVQIDADNNAALLTAFESNLAAGLELYRDANENGRPDGQEDIVLARGQ